MNNNSTSATLFARALRLALCGAALIACASNSIAQENPSPTPEAAPPDCKVNDPDIAASYSGECRNGLANGKGTATGRDKYVGEFRDGLQNGKGDYAWDNGNHYVGDWVNGKKTGKGVFTWPNGDRYEGDWANDKMSGRGIYTKANGERREGDFVDDRFVGKSMETAQEGNAQANFRPVASTDTLEPGVSYSVDVQNFGWLKRISDGGFAGTTGRDLRLEALKINLTNVSSADAGIEYQAHVQNIGWQNYVKTDAVAGTTGQNLRLEAIKIRLVNLPDYSIVYRAYVQGQGWQNWVHDGDVAGTTGQSKRMEAIEIKMEKKGRLEAANGGGNAAQNTAQATPANAPSVAGSSNAQASAAQKVARNATPEFPKSIELPSEYLTQVKPGCFAVNPSPQPGETASWTGQCKNGRISGYGTLKWYKNGQPNAELTTIYENGFNFVIAHDSKILRSPDKKCQIVLPAINGRIKDLMSIDNFDCSNNNIHVLGYLNDQLFFIFDGGLSRGVFPGNGTLTFFTGTKYKMGWVQNDIFATFLTQVMIDRWINSFSIINSSPERMTGEAQIAKAEAEENARREKEENARKRAWEAELNNKDPQAMYLKAGTYTRNGNSSQGKELYEAIIRRFTRSQWAVKASDQLGQQQRTENAEQNAERNAQHQAHMQCLQKIDECREQRSRLHGDWLCQVPERDCP